MREKWMLLLLYLFAVCAKTSVDYKAGSSSVFLGKDFGWETVLDSQPPFPTASNSWSNSDTTLYLSIASFRDKLCPSTLFNVFSKAIFPSRITVGVVQQNAIGDIDCLTGYCELMKQSGNHMNASVNGECPFEKNIRMMRVDSSTAKGPTWGRAKASTLLKDEEFCMQTDAHMDFVPGWDMKIMGMWADTKNEYAVLSTYVADSSQLQYNLGENKGLQGLHEVPHLCMVTLNGANNLVRIWGTKCARNLLRPKMTNAIWGAGLSFSKCHAERKSPYDPHTPFIFDGEEFSRAVRFWTWGYDIYTPHRVFVVHNYKISQADPNHFGWYGSKSEPSEGTLEQSIFRLKTLLEIPGGETDIRKRLTMHQSKYGLGDRRTLDQAIEFSGVDTRNQVILGNRCGNLAYVPFKEHPFGASFIPPYDPVSETFIGSRDPGSIYYNVSCPDMQSKWEDAFLVRNREKQRQDLLGLRLRSTATADRAGSNLIRVPDFGGARVEEITAQSGIAHIISSSSADGYGMLSQYQRTEGGLLLVAFFIIALIWMAVVKGKCHKVVDISLYSLSEKGNSVKTI